MDYLSKWFSVSAPKQSFPLTMKFGIKSLLIWKQRRIIQIISTFLWDSLIIWVCKIKSATTKTTSQGCVVCTEGGGNRLTCSNPEELTVSVLENCENLGGGFFKKSSKTASRRRKMFSFCTLQN